MNARTHMALFAAMLSLLPVCAQASSVITSAYNGALSLVNASVSPNPVVAGGSAAIRFQLYNSYGFWVYDVNIQAAGGYPLLNASPLAGYQIAQVSGGLNGNYFNYTVPIPPTTPSGSYTVYFNATYYVLGGTGQVIAASSMPVSFYVQNRPSIKVVASGPTPAALYSGYNQTVNLLVQNNGYGTARNVSVAVSGSHNINILSSVTTFFIPNLTQGSSVTEPVLVSTQGAGSASVLANITYYSQNLKQRFRSVQGINLSVAPAAQFRISSQGSGGSPGATDVPVRFTLTNTGTSEAQQVQLSLQSTYPITPVAGSSYVSDLPVGASANVTFLVSVDGQGAPGNYPVTIYEQWRQPNGAVNQQFSGSNNYYIAVARGGAGGALIAAVVVIIIAAGGAFVYKKRKAGAKGKRVSKK